MNDARNITDTMRIAITKGVLQPWETPSERPISKTSRLEVNKNAPIQSTSEARGRPAAFCSLAGSLGMTNIAVVATAKDVPAMTKKTTFQLVYSDIIPP